jgi:type IX secretion system PorP/SprF family membrane protein
MTRKLLFSLLFVLGVGVPISIGAQQFAQYSLYWLDPVQFNPAYAGLDNSLSMTGTYRTQWVGLDGQPVGQRFSAHLPVYFLSSGFGVEAERDAIGARTLNRFGASWNYQLVRSASVWSIGLGARYTQMSINGAELRTPGGDYSEPGLIQHNDDLLFNGNEGAGTLALALGVYYQSERLEGGLSARNLNSGLLNYPGLSYQLFTQYHGYLRANFDVLSAWRLSPMVHAYAAGPQLQVSVGAIARYDENIFAGAAYRGYNGQTGDAVVLMGGLNLSDKISVAYAYDLSVSGLRSVQDGSHEITLKYNLRERIGAGVLPPIIYNPRTKQ